MGNRPNGWRDMTCTLTLLEGSYRHSRYRAYPQLDKLFEQDLSPDEINHELNNLISKGKDAEQEVIRFVDYLISTWNDGIDEQDGSYPPKRKDGEIHPCQKTYEECRKLSKEQDLIDLVNEVQTPHDCQKGGCRRINKKTEKEECRFHFPKEFQNKTRILFEPHGRNSFGDILYRTKIETRRNDDA